MYIILIFICFIHYKNYAITKKKNIQTIKPILIIIKNICKIIIVIIITSLSDSTRTWSYSLKATRNMIDVTFSKQWIHFLRSDLCPPTSTILRQRWQSMSAHKRLVWWLWWLWERLCQCCVWYPIETLNWNDFKFILKTKLC